MVDRKTVQELPAPATTTLRRAAPFRPRNRQPVAKVIVLDDGDASDGEVWRIRTPRHVIGRKSCDTVISNDLDVSAQHVEIACRWQDGAYRWDLVDLESKNGTFLQITKAFLHDGTEVLIGGRRYVFQTPDSPVGTGQLNSPDGHEIHVTRTFCESPQRDAQQQKPRLVTVDSESEGHEYSVPNGIVFVGSDAERCELVIANDPFVSPCEASIYIKDKGLHAIQEIESLNGIWIRVRRTPLRHNSQFQIGEQRMRFLLPGYGEV